MATQMNAMINTLILSGFVHFVHFMIYNKHINKKVHFPFYSFGLSKGLQFPSLPFPFVSTQAKNERNNLLLSLS